MFENSGSLKSTVPTTSKWMSPNCSHNHHHHIRKSRLFTPPVIISILCENLYIFAFSDFISLLIAILLLSVETPFTSLTFQESIAFHLLIWMLSVKITQWKLAHHANSADYLIVSLPPCILLELSPTYQKNAFFCFFYSFSCLFIPLPLFHTSIIPSKSLFSLFPPFLLFPQKILHFLPYSTKSFNLLQQTIHFYTSHSKVLPTRFSSLVLKPQLQPPIRWSINLFSPNYFFLLT